MLSMNDVLTFIPLAVVVALAVYCWKMVKESER